MHQQRTPARRSALLASLAISASLAAGPSHSHVLHPLIKRAAIDSSSNVSVVKVDSGTIVTTTPAPNSTGAKYTLSGGTEIGLDEFLHLSALTIVPRDVLTFNAAPGTKLVVLYVTNSQTQIYGTLNGPSACDLCMVSPLGFQTGSSARINCTGSLMMSTANMLKFSGGGTLDLRNAASIPGPTGSGPVSGLLFTEPTGPISISASQIGIPVTGPQAPDPYRIYSLDLIGNQVNLTADSELDAFGSRLDLIGIQRGRVSLSSHVSLVSTYDPAVSGSLADVSLSGQSTAYASSFGDNYVDTGGRAFVRGLNITLSGSSRILAAETNTASQSAGTVRIDASGLLNVNSGATIDVSSDGRQAESPGSLSVTAGSVLVDGSGYAGETGFLAPNGVGAGEKITITATDGSITFEGGGLARVSSYDSLPAGNITLAARRGDVVIDTIGRVDSTHETGLFARGSGASGGGSIAVISQNLRILAGGQIDENGGPRGGTIILFQSSNISIDGAGSPGGTHTSGLIDGVGGTITADFGVRFLLNGNGQMVVDSSPFPTGTISIIGRDGLFEVDSGTISAGTLIMSTGIFVPGSGSVFQVSPTPTAAVLPGTDLYFPSGTAIFSPQRITILSDSTDASQLLSHPVSAEMARPIRRSPESPSEKSHSRVVVPDEFLTN